MLGREDGGRQPPAAILRARVLTGVGQGEAEGGSGAASLGGRIGPNPRCTEAMGKTQPARGQFDIGAGRPLDSPSVTVFRCANGLRPAAVPSAAASVRFSQPAIDWPVPVHEVAVPCTGKLQPEHLLKAFEAGADIVCVMACAEDNCHYLEGSRRMSRRADYVRGLLDELGLGSERLMVFHLPGSAREDMALASGSGNGSAATRVDQEELDSRLAAMGKEVLAQIEALGPSPLRRGTAAV